MGFLHNLSRLVLNEVMLTPQQKKKKRRECEIVVPETIDHLQSQIDFYDEVVKNKGIAIDRLHTEGNQIIRRLKIHIKHYRLGNLSCGDLKNVWIEAENSIHEHLVMNDSIKGILSEEDIKYVVEIYSKKVNHLKADLSIENNNNSE